jgi:HlyD family secretion protein
MYWFPSSNMKKLVKIALFLSAVGMSITPFACKTKTENTRPTIEKITESVYASGIVKSKNQYQVFSTVNGIIQKIWVKEGDLVKKGDPLFTIENEISKLQSDNAKLAADFAAFNTQVNVWRN